MSPMILWRTFPESTMFLLQHMEHRQTFRGPAEAPRDPGCSGQSAPKAAEKADPGQGRSPPQLGATRIGTNPPNECRLADSFFYEWTLVIPCWFPGLLCADRAFPLLLDSKGLWFPHVHNLNEKLPWDYLPTQKRVLAIKQICLCIRKNPLKPLTCLPPASSPNT